MFLWQETELVFFKRLIINRLIREGNQISGSVACRENGKSTSYRGCDWTARWNDRYEDKVRIDRM